MEKKKSYGLLIFSLILLAAGIAFTIYAHNTSYASSVETGTEPVSYTHLIQLLCALSLSMFLRLCRMEGWRIPAA